MEGGFIGGLKNLFEKKSTVTNAQAPQGTNGKNHVGIMFGSQTAVSQNGKS